MLLLCSATLMLFCLHWFLSDHIGSRNHSCCPVDNVIKKWIPHDPDQLLCEEGEPPSQVYHQWGREPVLGPPGLLPKRRISWGCISSSFSWASPLHGNSRFCMWTTSMWGKSAMALNRKKRVKVKYKRCQCYWKVKVKYQVRMEETNKYSASCKQRDADAGNLWDDWF